MDANTHAHTAISPLQTPRTKLWCGIVSITCVTLLFVRSSAHYDIILSLTLVCTIANIRACAMSMHSLMNLT